MDTFLNRITPDVGTSAAILVGAVADISSAFATQVLETPDQVATKGSQLKSGAPIGLTTFSRKGVYGSCDLVDLIDEGLVPCIYLLRLVEERGKFYIMSST